MSSCSSQLISSLHTLLCTPPSTPVKKGWMDGSSGGSSKDEADLSGLSHCCHTVLPVNISRTSDGSCINNRNIVFNGSVDRAEEYPGEEDDVSVARIYLSNSFIQLLCVFSLLVRP